MKGNEVKVVVNRYKVPEWHLAIIAAMISVIMAVNWGTVCAHRTVSILYGLAALFLGVIISIGLQYVDCYRKCYFTEAEHLRKSAISAFWVPIILAAIATFFLLHNH